MERVALYARVSSQEQSRHGLSLAEQERSLEEYAKANNLQVIDKYIDAGISARKKYTHRPELLRLLDDVRVGKIDTILFIKLDRWFRSLPDYYEVQKILDEHHVSWRATQEDYETVTASGRFKVNIMLSVAQDEADRTSERIKFVFDGKRERNEAVSGKVPKGYRIENKHIVLDEKTAPMVRKAFDVYLESGSLSAASRAVPELNLTYRSGRYMFDSEAYTGNYNGLIIPAIITPEEHQQALAMHGHSVRKVKNNRIYLFSGLLTCPICGRRLGGKVVCRGNGKENYYYICPKNSRGYECPNKKHYSEMRIEEYLVEHIEGKINSVMSEEPNDCGISYQPQRDAIKRKLSKLSELYMNDMIAMDDYKKKYDALNVELAAVPEDVKPKKVESIEMFVEDWKQVYMKLNKESRRAFWRKCIDGITLDENGVTDFVLR